MKLFSKTYQPSLLFRSLFSSITTDLSNACDCHVHIVGSSLEQRPQISARLYTAGPASLQTLRDRASPFDIRRFVIVQPSFYGKDNRCLLQALDQLGEDNGRGVIVIDPKTTTIDQLEDFHKRGVRGVRLNLHSRLKGSSNKTDANLDEQLLELVREMKAWHIQIFASIKKIITMAKQIEHIAPVPIVFDHYGMPDDSTSPEEIEAFTDLLKTQSHIWVKLSAPYRLSKKDPLLTEPPKQWLQTLLENIPDRCVWGSDWPHTPEQNTVLQCTNQQDIVPYRSLSYQQLFDDFTRAVGDANLLQKIFVTNPEKLYDLRV